PCTTGECEAQLWAFIDSQGILNDENAPRVHWIAAESLEAALHYMRLRHNDSSITEVRFLGRVEDGRGYWHGCRPVSHPRSSNRTCRFPASGFPTGFVADSRAGLTHRSPEPEHPQLSVDPLPRKLSGALRGHLVPPSQKMPHTFLHMFIEHFVSPRRAPEAEVRFPASHLLVQPIPHFFPWPHIAGLEMLSHFLFDPVHALLRRTISDVLPPRAPAEVRPEGITQKVELLFTSVPYARLPLVERQPQPRHHRLHPTQCLFRFSATENHEVVRVRHDARLKLLPTFGLFPSLQHPVHVQIREQRTDHTSLWSAAIIALPAR